MHFEGDAFISYAHLDNVELVEGGKGWVANLHRALEIRVAQLLGKQPRIWRDPKLAGNDLFAETLVERLRAVALLISVVSPRYLRSEWTQRELEEFWAAAEKQGGIRVGDKARVFKVLKTPVPLDKTPPHLQGLLGYEFFKVDPETGKIRELNEIFGPEAQRDFWIRLDDLAHDVCSLLEKLEAETGEALHPQATRETIYLAETTSDLREERESLKRALQQRGHAVLPARPLAPILADAAGAILEDLSRCQMSIHLIGRHYSVVPEGGDLSMLELQHELAIARANDAETGREVFRRLVWIPGGLTRVDPRQQQVIERLKLDPRTQKDADVLETSFEDLLTVVGDWLTPKQEREPEPAATTTPAAAAAASEPPRIYFMHDQRDGELANAWIDALFEQGLEVIRPIFEGDEAELREYHEENLSHCDGVLIFYGSANEMWLRRKLKEIQKSAGYGRTKPAPAVAICLVQKTPEKERFRTHEAMVIPQWDGVALEPLQPFISRLKSNV